ADLVEDLGVPRILDRGGGAFPFLGERGIAAVGGLGDHRGLPQRQPVLAPVAHPEDTDLVLRRLEAGALLGLGEALLVFLLGPFGARAHFGRALARRGGEVVDRPHPAQVRVAPFGARHFPPGGRRRIVLGGRDRIGGEGGGRGEQQGRSQRGRDARELHGTLPVFWREYASVQRQWKSSPGVAGEDRGLLHPALVELGAAYPVAVDL